MSKSIPTLQKYMTVLPHTVGFDISLEKAEKMMNQYGVRHLPVLQAGKLVGILSDRDIKLILTFKDVDPSQATVESAYTSDPYLTQPSAKLDEVCETMAQHKYSCALVVDNHKLVGIFTWVDALKAMGELLKQRFH